jgi:cell division protein FtsQ
MAATSKKKKSSGATKRKTPFPFRLWGIRLGLFFCVVAGLSGAWFGVQEISALKLNFMPVKDIVLTEPLVYQTQAEYQSVIAEFIGVSLLVLDLDRLRTKLEALPWIQKVTLVKRWPGNIEVSVIEFEPIANWNKNQVLNEQGFPLQLPVAKLPLAELSGPDNRSIDVMEHYLLFTDIFSTQGLSIKGVTLQPRGSWSMELEDGTTILLGEQSVLTRSRRVVKFLESPTFQESDVEYIDARYQNGVAIKIKQTQSSEVENDVAA